MSNYLRNLLLTLSGSLLFLALDSLFFSAHSFAAKQLAFKYGLFEESLPLEDLRVYAENSQASSRLQGFLNHVSPEKQKVVKQVLQIKIPVDIVVLDKLLQTEVGNKILSGFAQAIARRDNAGIQALRAAVILGSRSPEGLGLLSFLEAYPSQKITIDLAQAPRIIKAANLDFSSSQAPHIDNLSYTPLWQLQVRYQTIATKSKQYYGCLFGDSISAGVGNTLSDKNYNFALGGLSTISLVEQLKFLIPANVKCEKAIIAIGTNDALYGTSNELFIKKMSETIALVRSLGPRQIFVIPAFYSTVAASYQPPLAGTLIRVEEINTLIRQVAATEKVPIEAEGIQSLFKDQALKEDLTIDGVHLNAKGIEIYRQALLKILSSTP